MEENILEELEVDKPKEVNRTRSCLARNFWNCLLKVAIVGIEVFIGPNPNKLDVGTIVATLDNGDL